MFRITVRCVLAFLLASLPARPSDSGTFTVVSTGDAGVGTLRWAIEQANAVVEPHRITFDIPGGGVQTIQLLSALPAIMNRTMIDARTDPGIPLGQTIPETPLVQLDGSLVLSPETDGIRIVESATGSSVRGLSIGNFTGNGILVIGADACTLAANHIGCDASGTLARGNGGTGVALEFGAENQVGGLYATSRNVISGNAQGVSISDQVASRIEGNYIGTNAEGTAAIGNLGCGIKVLSSAQVAIGTPAKGYGNLISGNGEYGIYVSDPSVGTGDGGHRIRRNLIGTNAYGTGSLPNALGGLVLETNYSATGFFGAGNVISGNSGPGVIVSGHSNSLLDNFVGTTVDGTRPLGNGDYGISVEGYDNHLLRNVIGSNLGRGIIIWGESTTENRVLGNAVGTNRGGATDLGNGQAGIWIEAPFNFIGGTLPGNQNIVAFNSDGVVVFGGVGNSLRRNRLYQNTNLDLDLGGFGVTPNDLSDVDSGPNDSQNFPTISSVSFIDGQLSVAGSVETTPRTAVTIDLFSSPTCHPQGNGGGETWLDSIDGTTNSSGVLSFAYLGPAQNVAGYYFTATVTADEDGIHANTSEFSPCAVLAPSVTLDPPVEPGPRFALGPPRPQPARGTLRLPFTLARPSRVNVHAYDAAGRRVATLFDDMREAGRHEASWRTHGLAPGVYQVRLEAVAVDGSGESFSASRGAVVIP